MILKEPGGSKMLGNDTYDLDWWFYVIWNRFLAFSRQIFQLRSWKMLRIIINRMSQLHNIIWINNYNLIQLFSLELEITFTTVFLVARLWWTPWSKPFPVSSMCSWCASFSGSFSQLWECSFSRENISR